MLNRNQVIAEVAEASIEDYETGMQGCNEAAKIWMQSVKLKMVILKWITQPRGQSLRGRIDELDSEVDDLIADMEVNYPLAVFSK
ncbi:hypothetical protein C5167_004526 [Papaver somniferum]|uniref:Uncharacterized protein n=1 Tax=Papaver somniferum TaxID=3469 RepID=A0A4Y7JAY0_PAPSO|nr:hypothetical protein C5167_004526 [Papaver somniferum]